jgi:hypothetical protein
MHESTRRRARVLAACAILATLAVTGCKRDCPTCGVPDPPEIAKATCGDADEETFAKIERAVAKSEGSPEILMLSGGGSYGAWGAGFLNGWSKRKGSWERPRFDLVTGSSTGAIQGTWAMLGPTADEDLEISYTTSGDGEVYIATFPWLWFQPWRWGSIKPWVSIKNLKPLRERLKTYTPMHQVREIGRLWDEEDRVFLVGTVNLDLGGFCVWDMGKLANQMRRAPTGSAREKQLWERYIELIKASSSNPIIFDPADIDGDMHVDGGVRHQIFAVEGIRKRIADGLRRGAEDGYTELTPRIYAFLNGPVVPPQLCVAENIYNIGQRALTVLTMQAMIGNLYQAKAQYAPKDPGDPEWEFLITHIPEDTAVWPYADEFPKNQMKKLFEVAAEKAKNAPYPWEGWPEGGISPITCPSPL